MKAVILASALTKDFQPIEDPYLLEFNGEALILHWIRSLAQSGITDLLILANSNNKLRIQTLCAELPQDIQIIETEDSSENLAVNLKTISPYISHESVLLIKANQFHDTKLLARFIERIATDNPVSLFIAKELKAKKGPATYFSLDRDSYLKNLEFIEDPETEILANYQDLGLYYYQNSDLILAEIGELKSPKANDYFLILKKLIQEDNKFKVYLSSSFHQELMYPEDIMPLVRYFHSQIKTKGISPSAKIHGSAVISGEVVIEKNVKIDANAVIKGPAYIGANTIIGVNSFVRDSYIGADSIIGFSSEIVGSYLGTQVYTHANCLNYSLIGSRITFGAGTMASSSRVHAGIKTGNNIQVGVNTNFMSGVSIGSNSNLAPGLLVNQHIPAGSYVQSKSTLDIKKN